MLEVKVVGCPRPAHKVLGRQLEIFLKRKLQIQPSSIFKIKIKCHLILCTFRNQNDPETRKG